MNRLAIALNDTLDFRPPNAITGEVVDQPSGGFAIRIIWAPDTLPHTGPWLCQNSDGNFERRESIGIDETFRTTDSGAYLVAAGRGNPPVPAFLTPIQTWSE